MIPFVDSGQLRTIMRLAEATADVNLFQVVCDMLDLLHQMNVPLAAHTRSPGPSPSPTDAANFAEKGVQASKMKTRLKEITL